MNIKTRALSALLGIFALGMLATATVAADRPYSEGPIVLVSAIRTQPGMFDEYMKYVSGPYKQLMEEQKKAGVILSWAAYSVVPQGPNDPDLYLTTTYKNMAALDDLDSKTDPINEKVFGSLDKSNAASIDREKLRKLMGDTMMRQLIIK